MAVQTYNIDYIKNNLGEIFFPATHSSALVGPISKTAYDITYTHDNNWNNVIENGLYKDNTSIGNIISINDFDVYEQYYIDQGEQVPSKPSGEIDVPISPSDYTVESDGNNTYYCVWFNDVYVYLDCELSEGALNRPGFDHNNYGNSCLIEVRSLKDYIIQRTCYPEHLSYIPANNLDLGYGFIKFNCSRIGKVENGSISWEPWKRDSSGGAMLEEEIDILSTDWDSNNEFLIRNLYNAQDLKMLDSLDYDAGLIIYYSDAGSSPYNSLSYGVKIYVDNYGNVKASCVYKPSTTISLLIDYYLIV